MKIKITKQAVDRIKPSKDKPIFYYDTELTGFGVKAATKRITYFVEGQVNGKKVRKSLGLVTILTPDEAKKEARKILGDMVRGININVETKKARTKGITLQQAVDDYLAIKTISEGTRLKYIRSMKTCFRDWANKEIRAIDRDMIGRRFKERSLHSLSIANSDFRFLRAVLGFAMEKYCVDGQPLIPSNPCMYLTKLKLWHRIERRHTYIHPAKIATFWAGIQHYKEDTDYMKTVKNQCRFILFTGCRDQEAGKLKWENIDFDLKTVTFLHTKNHKTHVLPIGNYLFNFLKELKKTSTSKYVFAVNNRSGHIENHRKAVMFISSVCGVEFRLHDLRRTFASIANNHISGITQFTIKKLLNHSEDDVTAGYIQFETEILRKPMQAIEDFILNLAGVREPQPNNVIDFYKYIA